ncbi:hypothetical protein ISS07_06650 [Candidatus Woesearchaeota archaeon]|nr:hypothetical protein [Candidatus Woesearchaeota archaeon]
MRFKQTIKRITALGVGASMVGATIFGAMAAELSQYPSQYIQDGKFAGVMVVGDKAAAEDVIGVSDIAVSLQFAATKPADSAGTTVSASGEAWIAQKSDSNQLEMSEDLTSGNNRESIADMSSQSSISESELANTLADGVVSNSKGDSTYEQRLYFEDTTTGYVTHTEDREDNTGDFLYFQSGKQLARYELEFTTSLESDVDDSTGSATSTGTYLTDIEDSAISMGGKDYTVVQARRLTTSGGGVKLILMGGAVRDTLSIGETKTYTIDGKDYEATVEYVDADSAKLTVNGEGTRDMVDGDTDKLSDGTTVGISEILYQNYAGGVQSVEFFLGAQKIEMRDSDIEASDSTSSNELKVDDETIDGANVWIEGSDDNTTFKVDKIVVNMSADDDYYIPAGGKLSDNPELNEKDLIFTKGWDIEYKGMGDSGIEDIKIAARGSDDYELEFVDGAGNKVSLPLANSVSGSTLKFGDTNDDLVVAENKSIGKDDYFIVTDTSGSIANGDRKSFGLRYRGSDKLSADNPIIKFDELGSGDRIERSLSVGSVLGSGEITLAAGGDANITVTEMAQIKLGGGTFRVYNGSSTKANDFTIYVDAEGDNDIDAASVTLNTKSGASIAIRNGTDHVVVDVDTPNSDDYDTLVPTDIGFNITSSSGEVRAAKSTGNTLNFRTPDDDDDNSYVYTSYGTYVRNYAPTNSPQEVFISHPKSQSYPLVYVTGEGASFTSTAASSGGAVTVQRIDVGATKLASEVSNINAVNSILVGGPCANAASATVMGNPADCTAGFEPGVGNLQMFDVGDGNVAMLVAGYSAADTRNAAAIVANYGDYASDLTGDKVEVRSVNNVLNVAQPSEPVVEEAMEEEAMEEEAMEEEAMEEVADETTDETA